MLCAGRITFLWRCTAGVLQGSEISSACVIEATSCVGRSVKGTITQDTRPVHAELAQVDWVSVAQHAMQHTEPHRGAAALGVM